MRNIAASSVLRELSQVIPWMGHSPVLGDRQALVSDIKSSDFKRTSVKTAHTFINLILIQVWNRVSPAQCRTLIYRDRQVVPVSLKRFCEYKWTFFLTKTGERFKRVLSHGNRLFLPGQHPWAWTFTTQQSSSLILAAPLEVSESVLEWKKHKARLPIVLRCQTEGRQRMECHFKVTDSCGQLKSLLLSPTCAGIAGSLSAFYPAPPFYFTNQLSQLTCNCFCSLHIMHLATIPQCSVSPWGFLFEF